MKVILIVLIIGLVVLVGTQVRGYMIWSNMDQTERFAVRMDSSVDDEKVFGSVMRIESKDKSLQYETARGNLNIDDVFCAGSITKLFTATIIFQLVEEEMIDLNDTLDIFLTEDELDGLHYYSGNNYGALITIEQLISQTSGLPDHYLEEVNGRSLFEEIKENDRKFEFEEFLQRSKMLEPHFINGTAGKAYYTDINFDILGVIAERVTGSNLNDLFTWRIFEPLNLENTSLAVEDSQYAPVHLNGEIFEINLAKSSMQANGGIISNTHDMMIFLRAFMEGELFPVFYLENGEWNDIQFDHHQYKNGMMRFQITGFWSIFGDYELIGHSGSTGGFAFYSPEKEVYIVGTTNQASDPSLQYRLVYQLIGSVKNQRTNSEKGG